VKIPTSKTEMTFDGRDSYNFEIQKSSTIMRNYEEEINLEFKTTRSSGLLVFTGRKVKILLMD
jgi:hypothetical protein